MNDLEIIKAAIAALQNGSNIHSVLLGYIAVVTTVLIFRGR